jgi:hypothetical protein
VGFFVAWCRWRRSRIWPMWVTEAIVVAQRGGTRVSRGAVPGRHFYGPGSAVFGGSGGIWMGMAGLVDRGLGTGGVLVFRTLPVRCLLPLQGSSGLRVVSLPASAEDPWWVGCLWADRVVPWKWGDALHQCDIGISSTWV